MPSLTAAEYYAHHYPYERLVKLLTRNGDRLSDCEFAIEGKTDRGDKLYKRYVSVRGQMDQRDGRKMDTARHGPTRQGEQRRLRRWRGRRRRESRQEAAAAVPWPFEESERQCAAGVPGAYA